MRVAVAPVTRRAIERELRFTGDVVGEVEVRVYSTIPDRITALRADEGARVVRGEILAIVRSEALSQGVQQALGGLGAARAQVEGLRDTLARQRRLLASGVVTQAQVDATGIQLRTTENQVAQLEATVGSARTRRSDAVVRAPINGIIGQVFVEEGDLAAPQVPICTVVQMDRVEVQVQVSERDLGLVRTGMEAEIRVATVPGEVFGAPISRISPVVDRLSRAATVRVVLDNPEHRIRPGSLAEVRLVVDRHDNAVVIPQYSMVLDDQTGEDGEARYKAYVVVDGQAAERSVRVGFYQGDDVEILEGLRDGEQLVVHGQHLLREGTRVNVRTEGDDEASEQTGESVAGDEAATADGGTRS